MQRAPARYGDNPIAGRDEDSLDRQLSVDALCEMLLDPSLDTPLVVGIFGGWGAGKTSLLNMARERIAESKKHVVHFDAWRYSKTTESVWRALLVLLLGRVREDLRGPGFSRAGREVEQRLEAFEHALYMSYRLERGQSWSIDLKSLLPVVLGVASTFVPGGTIAQRIADVFKRTREEKTSQFEDVLKAINVQASEDVYHQVESIEQFAKIIDNALELWLAEAGEDERVYLFIDDLDRCLPEEALLTLEALRLFVNSPRLVTVAALDPAIIELAVALRYKMTKEDGAYAQLLDPGEYLSKLIQIPFWLPPLTTRQMDTMVVNWGRVHEAQAWLSAMVAGIVVAGIGPNPRRVKRCLNLLGVSIGPAWSERAEAPWSDAEIELLAKVAVLQTSFPKHYGLVLFDPLRLKQMEVESSTAKEDDHATARLHALFQAGQHRLADMDNEALRQCVAAVSRRA